MSCPSKTEMLDCLLGKLPEIRTAQLLSHADTCDKCAHWMEQSDAATDRLVASLRLDHQTTIGSSAHCERMIQRAERLVPSHVPSADKVETKGHLLEGTRVRDYEILRPIGEGGMGAVFLARHVRLKRNVAIKVLSVGRQRNSEAQRRFEQEMQIVGQLQHAGIVQALDAGEDHGIQYLVMEVVDGADLRRIVRLVGPLEVADACEITFQIAQALEYAHSRKLVHRDIKPSNVMLSREGIVKVMDLGIAKFADQQHALTSTQQALGSLDFMAPEQLQSQNADGRADIYALGCTLHFLLSGESPEKRRTASLLVSKSPKLEGLRHTLPPPLTRLLQHMLLADPTERCDSMAEVADRIEPFCGSANLAQLALKSANLVEQEGRGRVVSPTSEVPKPLPQRRRKLVVLGGVAAAAIVLLAAVSLKSFAPSLFQEPRLLSSLPSVSSNVEPIREIPLFQIHQEAIRCAAFCEQTSQLILGSDDHSISLRDLPNQQRIVCVMASDAPIMSLTVAQETNRFVAVDANGKILAFDLPNADLAWHVPALETTARPVRVELTLDEDVLVLDARENLRGFRIADGTEWDVGDRGMSDPPVDVQNVIRRFRLAQQEIGICEAISAAHGLGWVVSQDHRVWLLDADAAQRDELRDVFVYAEHRAPITALLTFASDSMVLSADAAGQARLWQAPNTRYSDMLLGCLTKIDSMEMTFALRRNRWTKDAFSTSPEQVQLDDHGGEMRITSTIQRDTRKHTLQYKVVSPAQ